MWGVCGGCRDGDVEWMVAGAREEVAQHIQQVPEDYRLERAPNDGGAALRCEAEGVTVVDGAGAG